MAQLDVFNLIKRSLSDLNSPQMQARIDAAMNPSAKDRGTRGAEISVASKNRMLATAMDMLQTTPAGLVLNTVLKGGAKSIQEGAEFFGKRGSSELGDKVLTESAKEPGKFQLTLFDGKLGASKPVRDFQFDTKEEALKAFDLY